MYPAIFNIDEKSKEHMKKESKWTEILLFTHTVTQNKMGIYTESCILEPV